MPGPSSATTISTQSSGCAAAAMRSVPAACVNFDALPIRLATTCVSRSASGEDAQPLAGDVELQLLPPVANGARVTCDGALDHLRDVDAIALQLDVATVDAREVQQVVDDFGEPRALPLDDVLCARGTRVVARGNPLEKLDRAADRRQRIAQLVRERREKRALALFEIADRRRGLLALGDVDARADIAVEPAIAVETRYTVVEQPAVLAVAAPQPVFEHVGYALLERRGERRLLRPEILRMNPRGPAVVRFLRERATGEFEPRAVDVDEGASCVAHPEQHGGLVGHHAKARLALLEGGAGLPRRGDVAEDEHEAAGGCIVMAEWR
jgi:hypothetical protein